MNIGIDQGLPRNDLVKFPDGKYLYKLPSGKLDIDKFNRDFEQYKDKRKIEMREQLQKKLDDLGREPSEIPAYNLSMGQILINVKDTILNILDDILRFKFELGIFTKDDRLFYLGILMLIIGILVCAYYYVVQDQPVSDKPFKIEIIHTQNAANP
jgi:hypothetical protein